MMGLSLDLVECWAWIRGLRRIGPLRRVGPSRCCLLSITSCVVSRPVLVDADIWTGQQKETENLKR